MCIHFVVVYCRPFCSTARITESLKRRDALDPNLQMGRAGGTVSAVPQGRAANSGGVGGGNSVATTPVKPMKILRRPAASAGTDARAAAARVTPNQGDTKAPGDGQSRVSYAVSVAFESALNMEKERLEKMYKAREEVLVRTLSNVLLETLPNFIDAAASREATRLSQIFLDLPQHQQRPPPSHMELKNTFSKVFAKVALPEMQDATRNLLNQLSSKVDNSVDEKVSQPTLEAANVAAQAAQTVASAQYKIKDIISAAPVAVIDPCAEVSPLIEAGKFSEAIQCATQTGGKPLVLVIESAMDVENMDVAELIKGSSLGAKEMVLLISVLANNLPDRTKVRLEWLVEILSEMDDDIGAAVDSNDKENVRKMLDAGIDNLKKFAAKSDGIPAGMAKHIKLVVHILNALVSTM